MLRGLAASLSSAGYQVVGVSSEAAWGKASNELVKLMYDPDVVGIVATDRNSAHLAEQIAVKVLIPVVAISSDRTLTSTNIPWIFRLDAGTPPADAVPVLAMPRAELAGTAIDTDRSLKALGNMVAERYSFASTGELRAVP